MGIPAFMAACAFLSLVFLGTGIPAYREQKIEIKDKKYIRAYTGNKAVMASLGYIISGAFALGLITLAWIDPDSLYGKTIPMGLLMMSPIVLGWIMATVVDGEVIKSERKPHKK
ncbi:MAG: hypothetical protein ABI947_09930 [Chloroflexota bacterium]